MRPTVGTIFVPLTSVCNASSQRCLLQEDLGVELPHEELVAAAAANKPAEQSLDTTTILLTSPTFQLLAACAPNEPEDVVAIAGARIGHDVMLEVGDGLDHFLPLVRRRADQILGYLCLDTCVDMRLDMCIGVWKDMCTDVRADTCSGMRTDV